MRGLQRVKAEIGILQTFESTIDIDGGTSPLRTGKRGERAISGKSDMRQDAAGSNGVICIGRMQHRSGGKTRERQTTDEDGLRKLFAGPRFDDVSIVPHVTVAIDAKISHATESGIDGVHTQWDAVRRSADHPENGIAAIVDHRIRTKFDFAILRIDALPIVGATHEIRSGGRACTRGIEFTDVLGRAKNIRIPRNRTRGICRSEIAFARCDC